MRSIKKDLLFHLLFFIGCIPFAFVFAAVAWSLNGTPWIMLVTVAFVASMMAVGKALNDLIGV